MTQQIITPQQLQPKIVTLADLKATLLPYCFGWKWAETAITDLWLMGAPMPTGPGQPEQRILLPNQFAKWWGEVQTRMGLDLNARTLYAETTKQRQFRNGGGQLPGTGKRKRAR